MKNLVVLLLLLCTAFTKPLVQRTWEYKNPGVVTDLAAYDKALSESDLDRYRYFDKRNTLTFENGLQVELYSANEVKALGLAVKDSHVRTKEPTFNTGSVFKLAANGHLVEMMTRIKAK